MTNKQNNQQTVQRYYTGCFFFVGSTITFQDGKGEWTDTTWIFCISRPTADAARLETFTYFVQWVNADLILLTHFWNCSDHPTIRIKTWVLCEKWVKTEFDLIWLFEKFWEWAWALIIQQWTSLPASAQYYIIAKSITLSLGKWSTIIFCAQLYKRVMAIAGGPFSKLWLYSQFWRRRNTDEIAF